MAASRRVRVVVTALEQFVERLIVKLALDIVANLVRAPGQGGTPVDTGWARANWVPRIGEPISGPVSSPEAVSTSQQEAGQSALPSYRLARGRVFVSNAVPYIVRLNEGSSRQAPPAFVQAAIVEAVRSLL